MEIQVKITGSYDLELRKLAALLLRWLLELIFAFEDVIMQPTLNSFLLNNGIIKCYSGDPLIIYLFIFLYQGDIDFQKN